MSDFSYKISRPFFCQFACCQRKKDTAASFQYLEIYERPFSSPVLFTPFFAVEEEEAIATANILMHPGEKKCIFLGI